VSIWRFVKTIPTEATGLAAASAAILVLKIVLLNNLHELFNGAYEIGVVIEGLLASIIASYVFYLIVVHLKEQSDRAVLYPFISKHSKRVVAECSTQLSDISKASNTELSLDAISKESLQSALSAIAPHSQAPLILGQSGAHADWFQYFHFHNLRSKDSIRKLFDQLPFLQAVHISLLSDIDDCSHFAAMEVMQGIKMKNPDLSMIADIFYDYCISCRTLAAYNTDLDSQSAP
jgi:hypothetical protein